MKRSDSKEELVVIPEGQDNPWGQMSEDDKKNMLDAIKRAFEDYDRKKQQN